jgi:hypothetical protein
VLGLYQLARLKTVAVWQVDVQQHQIKFPLANASACAKLRNKIIDTGFFIYYHIKPLYTTSGFRNFKSLILHIDTS